MKRHILVSISLIGILALCSTAQADRIMVGDDQGNVYAREDVDMARAIAGNNPAQVLGQNGIHCMAPLEESPKYAFGTGLGILHVKDAYDTGWLNANSANLTSVNIPIISIVSRADGHILVGTAEFAAIYRNSADCFLAPPGVTNDFANFDASDVTAVALLPNGHHVVATAVGNLFLRDKDDMLNGNIAGLPGGEPSSIAWGIKINDLAVDSSGNIVIGLEDGWVYTRHWANLDENVGSGAQIVSGFAITELEMLSNGNVVIGTSNGQVHVRAATALQTSLSNQATFTQDNLPITAMEVTSDDNVVIAALYHVTPSDPNTGQTWVRQGSDLSLMPVGAQSSGDGLIWNNQIHALAAVTLPADPNNPDGDMIMLGDSNGDIYGRDEFNPSAAISGNNPAHIFGEMGISRLDKLILPNKYAIGTGDGHLHVKDASDTAFSNANSANLTTINVAITSLVSRADGHILVGTAENAAIYRNSADCLLKPPGVTNDFAIFDNTAFTALALLPNGHHVVATAAGNMWLRDKDDMFIGIGGNHTLVTWGIQVNDMAVSANGDIVVGLANGGIYTRNWANLSVNVGTGIAGWGAGVSVEELEMLSNGNVVIGLSNGQVHVRSATDLVTSLGIDTDFSVDGVGTIAALEVTSNDNVVIAAKYPGDPNDPNDAGIGVTWVRQGSNLDSPPLGFAGSDGVTWPFPIDAIAAVPFVITTCSEAIENGFGLDGDLDDDCYVRFSDIEKFGSEWLECTTPGDAGCQQAARVIDPGTSTVDADLADWAGAQWITLDQPFFNITPDVSEARFAVRWDDSSNKLYCAVVVTDSIQILEDSWTDWKSSDRIEIYTQGSAVGGTNFSPEYQIAQQYAIGAKTTSGAWAVFGDGNTDVANAGLEYAVNVSGGQIIYEVALVQYDQYGGISGDPNVITDLNTGGSVRFDIVVGSRYGGGSFDFGMLSENLMLDKSVNINNIALYTLEAGSVCGDWGFMDSDVDNSCNVDFEDFAKVALEWMKCIDPDDLACDHPWE